MASALLMLLNPKRYGVIDIRVWQLLHKIGTVSKNAEGVGFTFKNWYQFLVILRYFAKKLRGERSGCVQGPDRSKGVPSRSPLQVFRVTAA